MEHAGGRTAARSRRGLALAAAITIVLALGPARAGDAGDARAPDGDASGSKTAPAHVRAEAAPGSSSPQSAPREEEDGARGASRADEDALIEALSRETSLHPDDAGAHYRLGLALRRAHRRTESVASFERAAALAPTRDRLLDLGVAYTDVSRFGEAEATYRRLLSGSPGDADALLNLANIFLRRGEFDAAIASYRQALDSNPRYLFAWYHLGHTLKFTGRSAEARDAYRRVLDLTPANEREQAARVDALYQLGSMDLARGKALSAEAYFAQVTKVAPGHRGAHWGRAQALLRLNRGDEARQEIDAHTRLLAERAPTGPSASDP